MKLILLTLALVIGEHRAGRTTLSDNVLETAGFVTNSADTPDKLAHLKALPPSKFVHFKTREALSTTSMVEPLRLLYRKPEAMDAYRSLWAEATTSFDPTGGSPSSSAPSVEQRHDLRHAG